MTMYFQCCKIKEEPLSAAMSDPVLFASCVCLVVPLASIMYVTENSGQGWGVECEGGRKERIS